jgi:hypothetical protein
MIAYYIYRLQKNKSDEIITHYAKRIIKTLAPHASTFTIFKTCYALIDLYKEDSKATCKALVHLYELGINPIQARDMNNIRLIEYIANNHLKCALFTDELVNLFGLFG